MREKLFVTFVTLSAVSLFGSLLWSSFSYDPMFFIVGYPVGVVFLFAAWVARLK